MAVTGSGYQAVEEPDDDGDMPFLRADASDVIEEQVCPECHDNDDESCQTCGGDGVIDVIES